MKQSNKCICMLKEAKRELNATQTSDRIVLYSDLDQTQQGVFESQFPNYNRRICLLFAL